MERVWIAEAREALREEAVKEIVKERNKEGQSKQVRTNWCWVHVHGGSKKKYGKRRTLCRNRWQSNIIYIPELFDLMTDCEWLMCNSRVSMTDETIQKFLKKGDIDKRLSHACCGWGELNYIWMYLLQRLSMVGPKRQHSISCLELPTALLLSTSDPRSPPPHLHTSTCIEWTPHINVIKWLRVRCMASSHTLINSPFTQNNIKNNEIGINCITLYMWLQLAIWQL